MERTKKVAAQFNMRETLSYAWVGVVGVALDAGFFFMMREFTSLSPVAMTMLASMSAAVITFPLNLRFTFQKSDNLVKRLSLYLVINLFGMALGGLMMFVGHDLIGIDDRIMKGIILVFVAGVQFLLNKFIAFK